MKAKEEKDSTGDAISSDISKNIKNKNIISNSKKKLVNIRNEINKNGFHQNTERKIIKPSKFSDKFVDAYAPDISGTNRNKKDNEIKKNSKIVEIDLIKTPINGKKGNNFMNSSQDVNISKLLNKKINCRNSAKLSIKNYNFKNMKLSDS